MPGEYLRDIRDLDAIGWWPAAPGWWLMACLVVFVFAGVYWWRRSGYELWGWRSDARRRLKVLRHGLGSGSPKDCAAELSELLRRIAIAQCGREVCAGLSGDAWLRWLADNDPVGFDWVKEGHILLTLPYSPDSVADAASSTQLSALVEAAMEWVDPRTKHRRPTCRAVETASPRDVGEVVSRV